MRNFIYVFILIVFLNSCVNEKCKKFSLIHLEESIDRCLSIAINLQTELFMENGYSNEGIKTYNLYLTFLNYEKEADKLGYDNDSLRFILISKLNQLWDPKEVRANDYLETSSNKIEEYAQEENYLNELYSEQFPYSFKNEHAALRYLNFKLLFLSEYIFSHREIMKRSKTDYKYSFTEKNDSTGILRFYAIEERITSRKYSIELEMDTNKYKRLGKREFEVRKENIDLENLEIIAKSKNRFNETYNYRRILNSKDRYYP